jgi:hypothetical protein
MDSKDCKGCSYRATAIQCFKTEDTDCPCAVCIVKMMCDRSCDEWDDWYINREKKEEHQCLD